MKKSKSPRTVLTVNVRNEDRHFFAVETYATVQKRLNDISDFLNVTGANGEKRMLNKMRVVAVSEQVQPVEVELGEDHLPIDPLKGPQNE